MDTAMTSTATASPAEAPAAVAQAAVAPATVAPATVAPATVAPATESKAIRASKEVIAQASQVAESYGLTLAAATRAFWTQMARTGSIPLSFEAERPNEESREAIRETQEIIRNGRAHAFKTADDMFASLGI